ncbi:unnamed protein product [Orchesella dallaii]|uniref:RING-type E3 ubiquitin transferase n=1 Tax=Orchesella dallaii TaxID=48710 RepID=A0ABP1PX71_9HEXA
MELNISGMFEELTFGIASVATLSAAAMYSKYKSISRNIASAPILTVGQDLSKIMKKQENLPYAIVTGRVFPLESGKVLNTISGMSAVISKLNVTEFRWVDVFSNLMSTTKIGYGDSRLSPSLNYVPFGLSNPNNGATNNPRTDSYVMVDDISNGEFDHLLLTAKATYVPTEVTFIGLVASLIRGFHSVGIETSESVLPVGTVITVIGEVTKLSDGHYRIAKSAGGHTTPYVLTTKNILEVKSSFHANAMAYKVLSLLCGCFTIMSFYALGKKWFPRFRMRRVRQLIQRERSRASTEGLHETQICLACLQNPREVALFPCGHVCLCADCSLLIQERCPVCRESVAETVPVYLA